MPETILIQYRLTRELWRRFFEAHYSCDRSLRYRYLWGVFCVVIGCLGFGGFYREPLIATLLLATGLYGVLSKPLLIARSMRRAGRHPFHGAELAVAISAEELVVRSGSSGYSQPWGNFIGYRHLAPGFLLYHDRSSFFFIPQDAMSDTSARRIEEYLAAAQVPKI